MLFIHAPFSMAQSGMGLERILTESDTFFWGLGYGILYAFYNLRSAKPLWYFMFPMAIIGATATLSGVFALFEIPENLVWGISDLMVVGSMTSVTLYFVLPRVCRFFKALLGKSLRKILKKEDEAKRPGLRPIWKFIALPILGVLLGVLGSYIYRYHLLQVTENGFVLTILRFIIIMFFICSLLYGIFGPLNEFVWKPAKAAKKLHYSLAKEKRWSELKKIGKPAVESLISCLKDEKVDVRVSAAEALGKIGDKRAVEPPQ